MIYYHIPTQQEVDDNSNSAKKLTRCGTPSLIIAESPDFVPVVRESILEGKKQGEPTLESNRYYYPAVDKTADELADDLSAAKTEALATIKALRDSLLDRYSSRIVIYDLNYQAAKAVADGVAEATTIKSGQMADAYAARMATAMGKTVADWSAYILAEWSALETAKNDVEECYLACFYNPVDCINAQETVEAVAAKVAHIQGLVDAITAASPTFSEA